MKSYYKKIITVFNIVNTLIDYTLSLNADEDWVENHYFILFILFIYTFILFIFYFIYFILFFR